ncbi:MAG: phage tail protein [bacterium]|nr:phage tail protein [Myxococcales bacterium]MCB9541201.1 phage tail protein [Myxococcales bacterium]MCB9551237.1 phage tail protein [Myxococcales bacterium]
MSFAANSRPYGKFRFAVEISGLTVGHFQSVSGLAHEIEVYTHQEGGLNDRTHKLPAQGSYPNLVLKAGYAVDDTLEKWHRKFPSGGRKNVTITLRDDAGQALKSWSFRDAWPVKWEGPEFDASQSQIAVQSIELAHNGMIG